MIGKDRLGITEKDSLQLLTLNVETIVTENKHIGKIMERNIRALSRNYLFDDLQW